MLSHADLHLQPEEELSSEHRESIERVFVAQERGAHWHGHAPVRYLELPGVTFVREDAGTRLPQSVRRASVFGGAGVLSALLGVWYLDGGALGEALLAIGALCLLGAVWWLVQVPKERVAMRDGPTRRGVFLLDDALLILGEAQRVIHRSELCGALMIPKGAITRADVVDVREAGAVHYEVVLRVRKSTGELVEQRLGGYVSPTRQNPLHEVITRWLTPPA